MFNRTKKTSRREKEMLVLRFLRRGKPVQGGNVNAPTSRRYGINTRTSGLAERYALLFGYSDFFEVLADMESRGKILIDRREHVRNKVQEKFPSWVIYLPSKIPRAKRHLLCTQG